MELKLLNSEKKLKVSSEVFGSEFNEPLVHQIVTSYMAAGRSGTKAQKTRAEVRGGGVKPFKQKGTGRARAGTIRSPIWRTGGRVFAAKPRDYKKKVNRKMYKAAIKSILSELIRQDRLSVINVFEVKEAKTKTLLKKISDLKLSGRLLIVTDSIEENLYLAARNLPDVQVVDATESTSDPVSLIRAESVLITEAAIKEIEGFLT